VTRFIFGDGNLAEGLVPQGFDSKINRIIALGYFDGVHLGHRKIMDTMLREAKELGLCSAAQTFSSIPISKRKSNPHQELLSTIEERCAVMEGLGVSEIIVFPFSERFSEISAMDYLNLIVKDLLGAKAVVVGHDFRFGAGGIGNVEMLSAWGEKNDIRVISVDPVLYQGQVISSSWIKDVLGSGDVNTVGALLGRPVSYSGKVVKGKQLGRTFGFPTANILPPDNRLLPPMGVYVSRLCINEVSYPSVTNIGIRPTVDGINLDTTIETLVIGETLDLYDQQISVFLLDKLRDEIRFSDFDQLKKQVEEDKKAASDYHRLSGIYSQPSC